ncbi:ribonuclease HI [Stenoxybacter acetivorans]|uniref:ribonuclease HI n=1 Tax=Stenoxybacter acetivorans TaxID=422441 RepID=UPI00055A1A76|nr:ribonuclease HI [Stenoxybacter acetivorans]
MNKDLSEKTVLLYSDGACKGNPGVGGWGVVLRYGSHEKQLFGGEADTTNNRMELTAVIKGLQALKRRAAVDIFTDSQYVKKGMTEWLANWQKNGWKNSKKEPVKNADLWQVLAEETAKHEVCWHWVRGHAGHEGNELADTLANQGAAQAANA